MFHVVSCSRELGHAWPERIYLLTYLLDCVGVRCAVDFAFQEENINYPAHESECPGPLSALRQARKKKTRGWYGPCATTRRRPYGAQRFFQFQGCRALFSLTADSLVC